MLVTYIYSFSYNVLTLSSIYTHFNRLKTKKKIKENIVVKGEIAQMSSFTFFHNAFYGICILKSFNNHISVVVCSFFEFGTISKWCIREWVRKVTILTAVIPCILCYVCFEVNPFILDQILPLFLSSSLPKFYEKSFKTNENTRQVWFAESYID